MLAEAKLKPIGLADDIRPRVVPGDVHTVQKHGIGCWYILSSLLTIDYMICLFILCVHI